MSLPISQHEREILDYLKRSKVVIVVGEPGSGKTTQIPQIITKHYENCMVAVTQPRRVASVSVANRVAKEMGTRTGSFVGYKIRFDNRTTKSTRIVFLTDGVLLRECLRGNLASKYRFVVLDEAHERSIHTDILIGLLKREIETSSSSNFRVVISSATLDSNKFSKFFHNAPIVKVSGRTFPVDVIHTRKRIQTRKSVIDAAIDTVIRISEEDVMGHVLLFLSGQNEIERMCRMLRQQRLDQVIILPLYGALRSDQQQDVFRDVPRNVRKVIVCTNIAETSITIPGIRFVIDCGFEKRKVYDADRRIDSLISTKISKTSAMQRAGRAGRTAPGKCYRLYTRLTFERELERETPPEILRSNLGNVVLYLKALNVINVLGFDFIDSPNSKSIRNALFTLYRLGAIDTKGFITSIGKDMTRFPLEPCLSRTIVNVLRSKCETSIRRVLNVASMLSSGDIVINSNDNDAIRLRSSLVHKYGDHFTYDVILKEFERVTSRGGDGKSWCLDRGLRIRTLRHALKVRAQLTELCTLSDGDTNTILSSSSSSSSSFSCDEIVSNAIASGFFVNAAKLCGGTTYRTLFGDVSNTCDPHLSSFLYASSHRLPECVVFTELVHTSRDFMRHVVAVKESYVMKCWNRSVDIDVESLSGITKKKKKRKKRKNKKRSNDERETKEKEDEDIKRRRKESAIEAARRRYLERRKKEKEPDEGDELK